MQKEWHPSDHWKRILLEKCQKIITQKVDFSDTAFPKLHISVFIKYRSPSGQNRNETLWWLLRYQCSVIVSWKEEWICHVQSRI